MAASIGRVDRAFISAVDMLDAREIYQDVLDLYNEEAMILDMLELTGKTKKTGQTHYYHFVNEWKYEAVKVASGGVSGTNGADNTVILTLDSTSHSDSGTKSFPKVGEFVKAKNGAVAFISAKDTTTASAHTITCKPADGINFYNGVAAGDYVTLISNGNAEGSDSPDGRRYSVSKYGNNIQIFKDKYTITDLQKASKLEVTFQGKPYWMYKAEPELFQKFRSDIAFQFLIGRRAQTLTNAAGETIYATKSLEQYIQDDGGYRYPLSTTLAKTDWKTINKKLDKERGPMEYWLWAGTELAQDVDDLFTTMEGLKAGGRLYHSFGGGALGEKVAIRMGVDSFKLYDRTIHKKKVPMLDHKHVTSPTGFNYAKEGFMIPMGKQKTNFGSGPADRICVRWLPVSGKKYRMDEFGKYARGGATKETSVLEIHYEAHLGLEIFGAKDFAHIYWAGS